MQKPSNTWVDKVLHAIVAIGVIASSVSQICRSIETIHRQVELLKSGEDNDENHRKACNFLD